MKKMVLFILLGAIFLSACSNDSEDFESDTVGIAAGWLFMDVESRVQEIAQEQEEEEIGFWEQAKLNAAAAKEEREAEKAREEAEQKAAEEEESERIASLSDEERLTEKAEQIAEDKLGKDNVIDVTIEPVDEGLGVFITYETTHLFSAEQTKNSIEMDMTDTLVELVKLEENISYIDLMAQMEMSDVYGNESLGTAARMYFEADTINQINPDNPLTIQENIQQVADHYNMHAEFME